MGNRKTDKLWSFFTKGRADKKHMTATCQIKVPLETGAICGKLLKTPDYNTSSMRTHLRSYHSDQFKQVLESEDQWITNREAEIKKLGSLSKKRNEPDHPATSTDSEAEHSPGHKILKCTHQTTQYHNMSDFLLVFTWDIKRPKSTWLS